MNTITHETRGERLIVRCDSRIHLMVSLPDICGIHNWIEEYPHSSRPTRYFVEILYRGSNRKIKAEYDSVSKWYAVLAILDEVICGGKA